MLRIQPATVPKGLRLEPFAAGSAVKAAYYSAAFIVRAIAAERLDIDPDEFDISDVRQVEDINGVLVGEIVINDHLANGAGFTEWVHQNWGELLRRVVSTDAPEKTFIGSLLSPKHRKCESSGYDCLRQYRNMAYHGLLDWRLGLSLLRILHSASFSAGLDGNFDIPDLDGWPEFALQRRDSFCASFDECSPREFGPLAGFELNGRSVVVVHPLWNTRQ